MGLFDRLRGDLDVVSTTTADALLLEGDELVEAVGESHYQDALLAVCGARRGDPVAYECLAALVPEPSNPHDPNAAMVQIDARLVAYLSRADAIAYRPALKAAAASRRVIVCHARIAGRGRESDTPNLGIFLKLPNPREALTEIQSN